MCIHFLAPSVFLKMIGYEGMDLIRLSEDGKVVAGGLCWYLCEHFD
jgi:hypothetical protein